ncbi:MAG: hypothetical protein E7158_06145 [Firmicutes bacterium]|nr:hypothetical protein [Bacillota bacterium]
MKKKNGFVFVETMIVIVTVLASLLMIYSAYVSLIRAERKRVRYDDPAFIYKTYAVGKFLLSFYDDNGNSIVGNKIKEILDTNKKYSYVNISVNDADLFSSGYGNGNEKRKSFFSQMYNELHIQNIFLTSKDGIKDIKNNEKSEIIPNNFRKYISTIDTANDIYDYYIVVEYAEKRNGKECSPNQLAAGTFGETKSESSCTFFYSNLNIDGGVLGE